MFVSQGLKRVRSNGMGVHTAEEIETFGKKDLLTLSEMLGEKEFFFGSEPAMLDLVVFSQVGQLVMVDSEVLEVPVPVASGALGLLPAALVYLRSVGQTRGV